MTQEKSSKTSFGTITSDYLIYNVGQRWFTGGSPEDIPLHEITHVELETRREPYISVLFVLVALACRAVDPIGIMVAIIPLAVAVLISWGSPMVWVYTTRGKFWASGLPWTRPEAEWLVAAVNRMTIDASQIPSTSDRHCPLQSGTLAHPLDVCMK